MAKKVKFTFKLIPKEKGLASVGSPLRDCHVRLNGFRVGTVNAPNWSSKDRKYSVTFAVKHINEENPNRKWKWVNLNKTTDTLDEMKEWLNEKAAVITEKYELHSFED